LNPFKLPPLELGIEAETAAAAAAAAAASALVRLLFDLLVGIFGLALGLGLLLTRFRLVPATDGEGPGGGSVWLR
jgi:hypothetical protein